MYSNKLQITIAIMVAMLVATPANAQNWVEKRRDRQEISDGQMDLEATRAELQRLREAVARARASNPASAADLATMEMIMSAQAANTQASAGQADREVRQSSRELRGDRREFRRNKDNDVSGYEKFRDRRNRRDDRRDRANDRDDAVALDQLSADQSQTLARFRSATSDAEKINHAIAFASLMEQRIVLTREELAEDKTELREDRRETRDDRRERFFRD